MEKDKILTFEDLFVKEAQGLMSDFILGHLQIEFILLKIVEIYNKNLRKFSHTLTHYKLIELVYGLKLISSEQKSALQDINRFRNKYAHDIQFEPTVADFKILFTSLQKAITDRTDGILQGLNELESVKTITEESFGLSLANMFSQVLYDLHDIYCDLGGDDWEFKKTD